MIETVIDAGATVINVPDSVGYAIPEETAQIFDHINEQVSNIHKARLSFHGQNDLGLCTANTLTAIQHGVRQVEVTVNGIGERAGNTSLEEVVMAIKTRGDFLPFYTDIDTTQLWAASQLVQRHSGMPVQFNKAVVGRNAFRHGSGIHQDGILKMRETWEIMDPRDIGVPGGSQLVMGKLSGRHAFFEHVRELGYKASDETLNAAFRVFKQVADRKSAMTDDDIALVMAKAGASAATNQPRVQA